MAADRQARAETLADSVTHVRDRHGQATYRFLVPSTSDPDTVYEVDCQGCPRPRLEYVERRALCSCPAGSNHRRGCVHVRAVAIRWRRDVSSGLESAAYPIDAYGTAEPSSMPVGALEQELRTSPYISGCRQAALLVEYGRRIQGG